tara:strand:+ start:450 stop:833 length:384 start_codon:yes stop_codon:yes gene_type:complete
MKSLTFFLVLLLSIVAPTNASAKKISYKTCMKVSQGINEQLPLRINRNVLGTTTYCSNMKGVPSLNYFYETTFTVTDRDEAKKMTQRFCTDKELRFLLEHLNSVVLHYFDPSGRKIDKIEISTKHCR